MNKLSICLLIAGVTAILVACGDAPAPDQKAFKVALLSPGPVSDAGWNAQAYAGLMRIKNELDAQVSQIETKSPAGFEEAFRDYARQGYRLVFGHGFEYQDAAAAVAPDFPNTVFVTTAGNTVRANVAAMEFRLEEATYLAGMLAASMSTSGRIGAVGGMQIPPVERTFAAFVAGARAVRPDIRFAKSYIGNWEDAGAAKQAALALIDQGCDFLIHNADAAAAGVFQAVRERNIYAFGTNKDQNSEAPQHIVASCVSDIPRAFLEMATVVRDGRFEPHIYELGMADNVVSFVINPQLQERIPAMLLRQLSDKEAEIRDGRFVVAF